MNHPGRLLVAATVLLLSVIWGTTWAAIRIGLQGVPPFTAVSLRFGIASLALLLLGRLYRVRYGRSRRERVLWLVNGGLSFCISYGVVYWCEQKVPSSLASVLFATFPLFVAILAHFALPDEALGRNAVAGILLGFGGVAVIFSEDLSKLGGSGVALASTVMLASPFVSAVASVAVKRWGGGIHHLSITAVPMGMAAIIMGVLGAFAERDRPLIWNQASVGALLYLALAGSAVTFSLYYWLLAHIPATRLALVAYMTPVVAVTVGALFMHEPYTPRTLLGSALVVGGVALAMNPFRREKVRPVAAALLVAALLGRASHADATRGGSLRFPADPAPDAVRSLGSLDGLLAFTLSEDGLRAAAAFEARGKNKSVVRVSLAEGEVREIPLDGTVRALRFGPAEDSLYAITSTPPTHLDSGESSLVRIDTKSPRAGRNTRLPLSAQSMDVTADGEGMIVACRNELRVVLIPDLRSSRLFRVPGENLSVAALPGANRVLVGRSDGIYLIDLSDPQERDGIPIRSRTETSGPVVTLVASPDGEEALGRLEDGRTLSVTPSPLQVHELGVSTAIAWPGHRAAYAPHPPEPLPPPVLTPPSPEPRLEGAAPPAPVEKEREALPPATPRRDETEAVPATRSESRPVEVSPPPPVETTPAPPANETEPERPAPSPLPTAAPEPTIRGRITGPGAGEVKAIVVLGPNSLLHEAARATPSPDGSWSVGPLPKGTYRIIVDAGGNGVALSVPPFATATVDREPVETPDLRVVSIQRP